MESLPPPIVEESLIPYPLSLRLEAFEYMDQLEGWCSLEKAAYLIDLVLTEKPKIVVEIGVFQGKSLIPVALALKFNGAGQVFGIDSWNVSESIKGLFNPVNRSYWSSINYEEIYLGLIEKIADFHFENEIILIRSSSAQASCIENIDLLHVDGNHSSSVSYEDVSKWGPLVRPGGVIILNDFNWSENEGPTMLKAIQWLDENCTKESEYSTKDSAWSVWRK